MPIFRPRFRAALAAVLGAVLLAGCSTTPAAAPSGSATTDELALGQNAAVGAPAALNPAALVPGSAKASPTATPPITVDPEFAQMANVLATGVAAWASGGTSLVGWALSEMLGAAGSGGVSPQLETALDGLSTQLGTINTQLSEIESQLSKVTNQIKDSTYQIEIEGLATNHIAPLLSMWQDYGEIIGSKDTNKAGIDALTSAALDSSTGAAAHIEAIKDVYLGSGTTAEAPLPGLFSTFVVNQGVPALDDRPLYQDYIVPYGQYFAALMVMGLTLQVEAYHQQGDQALAQQAVDTVWPAVYQVLKATGAPVSNDAGKLDIPTGNVWSTSPLCVTAQFDSADANNQLFNADAAQSALAITTSAMSGWSFVTGDRVCSIQWSVYNQLPSDWVPDVIQTSGLPAVLASDTTKPNSVRRDPTAGDFATLYSARGSATPQDYLNSLGFAIPGSDGLYGVTQLAHDFWYSGNYGYLDLTTGADTCLFYGQCYDNSDTNLSFMVLATPQCFLGTGDYKGLPTACGTDWLTVWPANPPTPTGPTTTPAATTPASTPAATTPATTAAAGDPTPTS